MAKAMNRLRNLALKKINENLIKKKKVNGKSLSYISWHNALDMLQSVFDRVDIEYPEHWMEQCSDKVIKNKNNQYVYSLDQERSFKSESNSSEAESPKTESQNPVVFCKCRLTVYYYDEDLQKECRIVREAIGSAMVVGGQNEQQSHYKAASSDALKKAIATLGIGLQLYRNDEQQRFFEEALHNPLRRVYLCMQECNIIQKILQNQDAIREAIMTWSDGADIELTYENIHDFTKWLCSIYNVPYQNNQNEAAVNNQEFEMPKLEVDDLDA